jgi:uracil-DNA glycosylase
MSRVFISYRRLDSEGYVGRLHDHLMQHFPPEDIFIDVASIQPGVDFVQAIEDAIAECDALIAIIGPQWLTIADERGVRRLDMTDDFVRLEIATALKQDKLVIPVLVQRAVIPPATRLPEDIAALGRRQAVELGHRTFGRDVEQLARVIKSTVAATSSNSASAGIDTARRKVEALKQVRDDLVNFTSSPLYPVRLKRGAFPVLGEGSPTARILFIGEAPGRYEAEQGRPFCGPSGEVLEEMLNSIGLQREDVYLTNVLHDSIPERRPPNPDEIALYTPFVDRIIDIIQPAVIAPLGRFAMGYILKKFDLPEKRGKISDLHGKLLRTRASYGDIHVVPLFHPAVVLYEASKKEVLRRDFAKLRVFL